jgi:restriction system protein
MKFEDISPVYQNIIFAVAAIVIVVGVPVTISTLAGAEVLGDLSSGFIAIGVILLLLRACAHSARRRALTEKAALEFIDSQAAVFGRRRAQLVFKDVYGIEKSQQWEKEKNYIFSTVIPTHLRSVGHSESAIGNLSHAPERLLAAIEGAALREGVSRQQISSFSDVAGGIDYEKFCAERLREAGWNVQLTKTTGDQGTDIIAEHNGRRVVLQCKFYTSPVGNKAVQEVVAARIHERADQAIVVSNATYTKSAHQLAATTGTLLLHHEELPSLADRLRDDVNRGAI